MGQTIARRALPYLLLAVVFGVLMCAGVALQPPAVRAANGPTQFDAHAARERLARILGDERPHPVDSDAQDAVRARLLHEIEALGFTPQVRDAFTCRPQPHRPLVDCTRVQNIIFTTGPADGPSVLALAHYDSVPAGPGASDDGVGVASWLEIARILSHERLTRRVIFVLSDGEEPGLIGAYSFGQTDPLMASVETLVNLDSRGNRGPAIFFETNAPNADAVNAFASVPRGVANSVAADIYHLLPNSTDVTALMRPELDVVNIAMLDGLEDYHTPQDTLASADPRTLQHMGDTGLAVTRRLASAPDRDDPSTLVYTDIADRAFVSMPSWLGQGALALGALIALFAFWRAGAQGRWRAFGAPLLAPIVSAVIAFAVSFALGALRPGVDYGFAHPEPARAWCVLLALLGAVLALMTLRVVRNAAQIEAAALFWFALLGFGLSFLLGGVSILFVFPVVAYALSVLIAIAWKPAQGVGGVVAGLLALVIWAPLLSLTELALGFAYPFATTLLMAMVVLVWFGPLARAHGELRWRGVAITLGVAAVIAIVMTAFVPAASQARPQPVNISYFYDASDNRALIHAGAADSALPQELASSFTSETLLPGDTYDTWTAPMDATPFTPPSLDDRSVTEANGERTISGTLHMNGAYRAIIRMPIAARPLRATVNGVAIDFAQTGGEDVELMSLGCVGRACEGAPVTITVGAAPGEWSMIGIFPGAAVPPAVREMRARRPDTATPIQNGDAAYTYSRFAP